MGYEVPLMNDLLDKLQTTLHSLEATPQDSKRLFHGRGQCYPGLEHVTADLYDPVVLITLFKASSEEWEAQLADALRQFDWLPRIEAVVLQRRYLKGAPAEVIVGELPEQLFALRGEARYTIKLGSRQNTGFFLDMEPGRQWLEARCEGKRVLNLFSYTCAFSVVAQMAGALSVVNVDMSKGALAQGRENHRLNNLPLDEIRFLGENIMKSWGRVKRPGPYDVAIIDPPSYQPGSFVAAKDYGKILRRIPDLLVSGGDALVCLNAPELGVEFIQALMAKECPDCTLVERLEPSPDFPDVNPDQQLKLFHFKYQA
jgi:23S rRNA (cytosine1962-C5)-methyltransferase